MKRVAEYLVLALLVIFLITKGMAPAWKVVHSDFANYYVSAKLVTSGESLDKLYDNLWFQERIKDQGINTPGKFSPFPPVTAWIMLPLTSFDALTAQRIFLFINLGFLFLGIILLQKITSWKITECGILVLGGGLSIINNFAFGQVYWIMTAFTLLAIILAKGKYFWIAGLIFGFFISLKYFPVVFVGGYFLIAFVEKKPASVSEFISNNNIKIVIWSVITLLAIFAAEYLFFGSEIVNEFFQSVFLPHLDGTLTGQGLYSFHYQSWDNLFRNLFIVNAEFNPSPFIDWPEGKTVIKLIVMTILVGWMLYVLYRYKASEVNVRRAVYLSVPAFYALTILPITATYHFALLLVPLSIIIGEKLLEKRLMATALIIYGLIGFIPYGLAFRLGQSWGVFFAYPRLWLISALYAIVVYGLLKKKELISASYKVNLD